ncbi:glycosyltransferase [Flaviflexus equikiangi]|uniref:Glycosyltransferase n=1 Tax=Flaviflexus equikiangi TaxID=2758573 RepID=A0ABS2TFI4_9ACTO|nr:glycosyltransferase [Flaviflexus equikiangi]MBM9433411.1 glycosyltransferase [Flaviflexus equikiangi]
MKVLVVSPFFEPAFKGGGPIQSLTALINAREPKYGVKVLTSNYDLGSRCPVTDHADKWIQLRSFQVLYSSTLRTMIQSLVVELRSSEPPDLVYLNSFFDSRFAILPQVLARVLRWPSSKILIAPRGELQEGALAIKSRKKKLYLKSFRALRLHNGLLWHVSSFAEEQDVVRQFGDSAKVFVRENEVSLPSTAVRRERRDPGACRLIFASRISEKKGLHLLLEALSQTEAEVYLTIVGGFEEGSYERKCRTLAASLPKNIRVEFLGALPREDLLGVLQHSDLLVLPTAGENFGHIIPEALSTGCPVMCSELTPWTSRLQEGGGLTVDTLEIKDWSRMLEKFVRLGEPGWLAASHRSSETYNFWRIADRGDHIFTRVFG